MISFHPGKFRSSWAGRFPCREASPVILSAQETHRHPYYIPLVCATIKGVPFSISMSTTLFTQQITTEYFPVRKKKLYRQSIFNIYPKLFHYAGPSHSLAPWGILNSPLAGLSVPTHSPLHFKTTQQLEPCFHNPLLKIWQQFAIAFHWKSKILRWL